MASYERMRGRLPSLYKPDDDDYAGQVLPLEATDIVTVNGRPPAAAVSQAPGGPVFVTPARPAGSPPVAISWITLAPGRAPGSGYTLAIYGLENGRPAHLPAAFAPVHDGLAIASTYFAAERFAVQLRRGSLLVLFLRALGQVMEDFNRQTTNVLQAHWFDYADSALYDPYFLRRRQETPGATFPPQPGDPEVEAFNGIHDLARLAALLPVLPWGSTPATMEPVEEYRDRIRRTVEVYKNGLGTLAALRGIVAAELPEDLLQPAAVRQRPFTVEESAALTATGAAVRQPGPPLDLVGPLMRWNVANDGLQPASLTIYVQGVAPQPGSVDAARAPVIELTAARPAAVRPGGLPVLPTPGPSRPVRLGIAYSGTLAADQTLRLRPAYLSWLGRDDGLLRSQLAAPGETTPADPTAAGPWAAEAGGPDGAVRAILQATDRTLWVAAEKAGAATLWRYDGQNWQAAVTGLPPVHCLAEDPAKATLLVASDKGLVRVPLYPPDGQPFTPDPAPAGLSGAAIFALRQSRDGTWWLGTAGGAARLDATGAVTAAPLQGTPVHALAEDGLGMLYCGAGLGLFQYQPATDSWFIYAGGASSEQGTDWLPLAPAGAGPALALPAEDKVFLPGVLAVQRAGDSTLWLGTEHGLARYVASPVAGLAYTTALEAFPDLGDTAVTLVAEDERGQAWFGTGRGLWRYDGRDLWQVQGGAWKLLGQAALLDTGAAAPAERGRWRYSRSGRQWQRFAGRGWLPFAGAIRTTAETATAALAWTDAVVADLGQWDGAKFNRTGDVAAGSVTLRFKPDETRALAGGLPAAPRLPVGLSTWRYLALEAGGPPLPAARPAWTCEGRLLPPPPDLAAAHPGRYGDFPGAGPADGLDEAVFAYLPAARVWFAWQPRDALSVLVRLAAPAGEQIDPAVLDRVWKAIQRVRPAGVQAALAVGEEIVRGKDHA